MIQDLGSRNGTFVDQRRLTPGEHARLVEDSVVAFGNKLEAWRIVGAQSPPDIVAMNEATGEVRVATDGMLTLSGDHDIAIFLGPGAWLCEREDGVGSVVDGGILNLGANRWVVRVNGRSEGPTTATVADELTLATIELVFHLSRDEEFVRVALKTADRTIDLGPRAHNYLLLTLARRRLADSAEGISDAASGWIGMEECARDVGDGARLNIDIFRVRKQFLAVGVEDGGSIIERRPIDRQIRIGTSRLSVVGT
jgi:FHA domain